MLIEHTIKKEKEINNKIKQKLVLLKSNNKTATKIKIHLSVKHCEVGSIPAYTVHFFCLTFNCIEQ